MVLAPSSDKLPERVLTFNSEGHSASALLPGLHHVLPGSLEIALKRTRPRQRLCIMLDGILCASKGTVKREIFEVITIETE